MNAYQPYLPVDATEKARNFANGLSMIRYRKQRPSNDFSQRLQGAPDQLILHATGFSWGRVSRTASSSIEPTVQCPEQFVGSVEIGVGDGVHDAIGHRQSDRSGAAQQQSSGNVPSLQLATIQPACPLTTTRRLRCYVPADSCSPTQKQEGPAANLSDQSQETTTPTCLRLGLPREQSVEPVSGVTLH